MASIRKQKSGSWRVQVRRKGRAVSETFIRYEDAKGWPDHASYIDTWLEVLKGDRRFVFTAAAHAERAATYVHGQGGPAQGA